MEILKDLILTKIFFEIDRRARLFSSANLEQCFRLVHNQNNSQEPGFTMDQYGERLVINWYKESWGDSDFRRFKLVAASMKKSILVQFPLLKSQNEKGRIHIFPEQAEVETSTTWAAKENDLGYELREGPIGLPLNQRLHRAWVLKNSANKSVLNLFCSNGSYATSAVIGGAKEVTAVELNKQSLSWAKKNLEINNIDESQVKFLCRDSFTFLQQCESKNVKFDLIICDAPSFYKREKGNFKLKTELEVLLSKALLSLNPKGTLLFSTALDELYIDDFRKLIIKIQTTLKFSKLELSCILPAMDFELPDTKANLKSFLIRFV